MTNQDYVSSGIYSCLTCKREWNGEDVVDGSNNTCPDPECGGICKRSRDKKGVLDLPPRIYVVVESGSIHEILYAGLKDGPDIIILDNDPPDSIGERASKMAERLKSSGEAVVIY